MGTTAESHAIVYLARGVGGGIDSARSFLASYRAHAAGLEHDLVVLAKGWDEGRDRTELASLVEAHAGTLVELPDDGFDWGAYMRAAHLLSHNWLCFLNTHSRIQADHWLAILKSAAEHSGVGAAGATGSWGALAPVLQSIPPIVVDIAGARGLARASLSAVIGCLRYPIQWAMAMRRFPPFPNPHLRSNAFLTRRALFLEFAARSKMPRTKYNAFPLESGRKSFTAFMGSKELRPVVATADGSVYRAENWDECGAFRSPGQPGLLVSDNQTRAYDAAPAHERRIMERAAWGRTFTPRLSQDARAVAAILL